MKKLILISMLFLLCSGCQTVQTILKPVLSEEGEVYVYIRPLPQEANNLRFTLESITAVRSDGVEVPLSISKSEFSGEADKRQRFVASGRLAPGPYRGLNIRAGKAFLKGEAGETQLVVQEKPEFNEFSFEVRRKRGIILNLAFRFRGAVGKGGGFRPEFSMSIPPKPLNSLIGYATNNTANSITVFDRRSGEVMGLIPTGGGPKSVVIDRSTLLAYLVVSGDDAVDVIDLQSGDVINRIRMNPGDNPWEAALTPDGKTLLVSSEGSNTLSFIDPVSNFEQARVNVGNRPRSVIIDPAGVRAYVFNYLSNSVSVININARSVSATLSTEASPVRGQFNRKGDRLFIYHDWSPNVLVFDAASLSLVKKIYVGNGISFIKIDPATDRLYVAKKHDPMISIYDPFSAIPMDFLKAAGGASYMLIDDEERNLLLALPEQDTIQGINLISRKQSFLVDTGNPPYWASITGER